MHTTIVESSNVAPRAPARPRYRIEERRPGDAGREQFEAFVALSIAKQARSKLDAALKIDPAALEGSAYTSLGTLYYKVPGFPLGFGDRGKARKLLQATLKLNPDGIDPNNFYGELLFEEGEYAAAIKSLRNALASAPRPNRELADQGRRGEIEALLAKAQRKLT